MSLKDSGKRQVYSTGAQKEPVDVRKGRYDLIPAKPLHRLAVIYARGAEKYAPKDWEKGLPLSRLLDSALRHINQWKSGLTDEDHLAQAAWQVFALMHTEEAIRQGRLPRELDDVDRLFDDEPCPSERPANAIKI